MPTIDFRIDKKGEVHIDVKCAEGVSCEAITKAFEDALGGTVETQRKPEFYVEYDDLQQKVGISD
jgi:hypothetical protein